MDNLVSVFVMAILSFIVLSILFKVGKSVYYFLFVKKPIMKQMEMLWKECIDLRQMHYELKDKCCHPRAEEIENRNTVMKSFFDKKVSEMDPIKTLIEWLDYYDTFCKNLKPKEINDKLEAYSQSLVMNLIEIKVLKNHYYGY